MVYFEGRKRGGGNTVVEPKGQRLFGVRKIWIQICMTMSKLLKLFEPQVLVIYKMRVYNCSLEAVWPFEMRCVQSKSWYVRDIQLNGRCSTMNMTKRENKLLPTICSTGIQKREGQFYLHNKARGEVGLGTGIAEFRWVGRTGSREEKSRYGVSAQARTWRRAW